MSFTKVSSSLVSAKQRDWWLSSVSFSTPPHFPLLPLLLSSDGKSCPPKFTASVHFVSSFLELHGRMKRFWVRSRVPRHGEGLARKEAGMIRLWTVSFRKLGTIRSDGQNTRLNLCLVVQRSVRGSDSEHGAKELSGLSVLKTNFKPSMRSPVSAQNWISASRSLQVSWSSPFPISSRWQF